MNIMYEHRLVAPVCYGSKSKNGNPSAREDPVLARTGKRHNVRTESSCQELGRGNSSASTNNAVVSSVPGPMPMTLHYRAGNACPAILRGMGTVSWNDAKIINLMQFAS